MKVRITLVLALLCTLFSLQAQEWTILFDGNPTDQLRGYRQKTFPTNNWVIDGDALKTVPGRAIDLITKEIYENFEFEVEWMVKAGGNSGVIYRTVETNGPTWYTGPEMQVLD